MLGRTASPLRVTATTTTSTEFLVGTSTQLDHLDARLGELDARLAEVAESEPGVGAMRPSATADRTRQRD